MPYSLGLIVCQENVLKKVGQEVDHEVQKLKDKVQELKDKVEELREKVGDLKEMSQALRDGILHEEAEHRKTQERLSEEQAKRTVECKVCYDQPDQWVVISCGHMFCKACADIVQLQTPKRCPNCRAPIKGSFECLPFAG